MARALAHTHKFKRHHYKSTGNKMFFCTLPDCHFKIEVPLALGKKCVCWRCGKDFTINEASIRLAKPHCDACTKPKKEIVDSTTVAEVITKPTTLAPVISLKDRLSGVSHNPFAVASDEDI